MKIAILGAGVAGLSAAYELVKAGHDVTVFEKDSFVGGLASGFKDERWDWPLERFYHHIFASDEHIIKLANEIGAPPIFRRPLTGFLVKGKVYPFDSALSVLLFPGNLNIVEKLRIGLVVLYLKLSQNWQGLEKYSAHTWLARYMGRHAYLEMWEPLLYGKFGDFYRNVNMAWFWARIHARTPRLGYFEGGFQAFADKLAAAVRAKGGKILLQTPASHIAPLPDGRLQVETAAGTDSYDKVIVTLSPGLLARLAPSLPASYLKELTSLDSLGAVVMTVALEQRLTTHGYWVNMNKREFPFLAVVEHTNFMDREHYGGDYLVYIGDYVPASHRYFAMSNDELADTFLPHLTKFNPAFDRSWVRRIWVHKETYAQPVVTLNHSQRVPAMETPVPNLLFASMSQVYPWDRGTNFAVELGQRVAELAKKQAGLIT